MKKIYTYLITLCLSGITAASSQTINTYAGTGASGSTGDGGPATAATFGICHGMATDTYGNLYIADAVSHKIRKVTPGGVISTLVGTGVAGYNGEGIAIGLAQINNPYDLTITPSGDIYFCETAGNRVRRITEGVVRTVAGDGVSGFTGDGGPATAARVNGPSGITTDAAGNVYFSDGGNNRIRKISTSGDITTIAGTGATTFIGSGLAATATPLNHPNFLCLDASGNLYASINGYNRIIKIDAIADTVTVVAGNGAAAASGDGGPATAAGIGAPAGLTFDRNGNLFIVANQPYNNNVRMVAPDGTISTFTGTGATTSTGDGGPAVAASVNRPIDIVIDDCDRIYVSEGNGRRVRSILYDNRAPLFANGASLTVTMCATTADSTTTDTTISTGIAIIDTDRCQTETWTIIHPPVYGTLTGTPAPATATGTLITPAGFTYSPAVGYTGWDTVIVQISDGTLSDTFTYYAHILPCTLGMPGSPSGQSNLSIHPNPGNGMFTITMPAAYRDRTDVTITDITGKTVKTFSFEPSGTEHFLFTAPLGTYILLARQNDMRWVQRLIVN